MIDTMDLEQYIDYSVRNDIFNAVNRLIKMRNIPGHTKSLHLSGDGRRFRKTSSILITASFADYGIQEFGLCCDRYPLNEGTGKVICRHYIRMTIKPASFLYPYNPYALSRSGDMDEAERGVNRFIEELNRCIGYELLQPAVEWRVTRVDYAYQFSDPYYMAYLVMFKKECPKQKSRVYLVAGEKSFPAEIRYWNKNICFHVYDKTRELLEKHDYVDRKTTDGSHMLRFEIQCKGRCLSSIAHKYGLGQTNICNLWNPKIADMKIRNAINKCIGKDDFYNLSSAREVLSQYFTDRKVRDMVDFIRPGAYPKTKGNRLVDLYAEQFGLDKKHVKNNFLPSFHKAGVNIRILPDAWGIDHLVNPVKILGLEKGMMLGD